MTIEPDLRPVLACYGADCQPTVVEFLASAGGFSGALLWRLCSPRGPLCLRRWPQEHPTLTQLPFIHAILRQIFDHGVRCLPVPVLTIDGQSFVEHAGHLWELTPWMPGEANYARAPTPARLAQAMQALARFHRAAENLPLVGSALGVSPGILTRHKRLQSWATGDLDRLRLAIRTFPTPHSPFPISGSPFPISADMSQRAVQLCDLFSAARPFVEPCLAQAKAFAVPLAPCIRDIWHDHVLFTGDEVTGLIDFGALATDNVATDIARLLGSLVADDAKGWRRGLAAYEEVRKLSAVETLLVTAFDRANVLLSGLNWCRWQYLEGRRFADQARVLARVDENLRRLARLAANGAPV